MSDPLKLCDLHVQSPLAPLARRLQAEVLEDRLLKLGVVWVIHRAYPTNDLGAEDLPDCPCVSRFRQPATAARVDRSMAVRLDRFRPTLARDLRARLRLPAQEVRIAAAATLRK